MSIKIKYRTPNKSEFTSNDIIIDVKNGCLFYKSDNDIYKVQGDNLSTEEVEGGTTYNGNTTTFTTDDPIILSEVPGIPSDGSTVQIGKRNSSGQGTLSIQSSFGAVDIGHCNDSFVHFFETGASLGYYFDSQITNGAGIFSSHNGNTQIQCNRDTTKSRIKVINSVSNPLVEIYGDLIAKAHGTNATGKMSAENDVVAFASDKRLKENIIKIPDPLEKIKQLRGVYYDWKKDVKEKGFHPTRKTNEIGMIAQEVEKVIPQAIEPAPFNNEYKTIKYDRIIPLLVECIKDQQKQIDELKLLYKS